LNKIIQASFEIFIGFKRVFKKEKENLHFVAPSAKN